ncbi:MAG: PKD domain-containing protein [Methanomicrobiales archaeon]|nr:PKD domain-containing protein [Methanomicrobiales archaeon]
MRKTRPAYRAMPVIMVLLLVLLAGRAHGMECLITVNTPDTDQQNPDISGERIVWEDWSDGLIRLYDLAGGTDVKVAPSDMWQTSPAISGSLVAWEEVSSVGTMNITYRDLLTGTTGVLTTDGISPAVSGQRIVWVDSPLYESLSLYDGNDGTTGTLVSNGDPTNEYPALSGDGVVWANGSQRTISYKNLTTGEEILIASDPLTMRINPVISGGLIVWQDRRNGNWDLYLYNLSSGLETRLTAGPGDHTNPAIDGTRIAWANGSVIDEMDLASGSPIVVSSGDVAGGITNSQPRISSDRVAWQKYNTTSGYYDIFLSTVGSTLDCPVAGFEADPTSGGSPLEVQFTSTSTGAHHWLWDFGDGTASPAENPLHPYPADGTYSVSLTVGNAVGRDYTSRADLIRVSLFPTVFFSANQTYGIAPLPVQFNDTSSGDPTAWSWDFGDGTTSADQNSSHTYLTPGSYSVALSTTNANGTVTRSMPGLIQVLNGVNLRATTDIGGLTVRDAGGRQEITLDSTAMVDVAFNWNLPASFSFTPQPSSGWRRVTFSTSDGIGFARDAGGILRGNLTSCTFESLAIVPTTFTGGAGNNLPLSYTLQLGAFPVLAGVNATVWEGMFPGDDLAFRHTLITKSPEFASLLGTAYTLSFVTTNLSGVRGASLNLSVATPWVQGFGGANNITVIRLGDDGIDEVLNPSTTSTDTATNLDFFTVPSPHGLSRFALVSAVGSSNLIQMGARVATQLIQSSGVVGGGGSGSPPSVKDRTPWEQPTSPANTPARPAVTYYGEGKIDTTPTGITRESVIIKSADWGASLAIDAGTVAFNSMHEPLTFVTAQPVTAGSIPPVADGAGTLFTGIAYDVGPDGATFNPPATLSFTVPGDRWNENTRYSIQTYSTQAGSWEDITTSVDPGSRIVSGQVSHLCIFGLFTVPAAGAPAPARGVSAPAVTSGEQPKPLPRTPMGIFTGMLGWIYDIATTHILVSLTVLFCVLASVYAYTRRAWLSRNRTWITLYLISLTGLLWASFVYSESGSLPDSVFIITTVTGLNLIVHILRFDRIDLSSRALRGYVEIGRR